MSLPALVVSAFAAGFAGVNEREPLHEAAYTGNILQAHFALLRCPGAVNAPTNIGKGIYPTPIHIAAERNRVGVLKLLLARGGKVNDPGKGCATPLQLAAFSGSTETAELLLKHGATLDIFSAVALNKWQKVELWFRVARYCGWQKKLANASTAPWSTQRPLLGWAVHGGHYRMVELLIHHGADVNPASSWWPPLLHEAMEKGRYDLTELLIRSGANVDAQDRDGRTALHWAVARKDVDAACYLLKQGASTEKKQDFHAFCNTFVQPTDTLYTSLHLAVDVESPELVALLLAHGASLTACDTWGRNPLDVAVVVAPRSAVRDMFQFRLAREESEELSPARELCIKLLTRYGGKPSEPQK